MQGSEAPKTPRGPATQVLPTEPSLEMDRTLLCAQKAWTHGGQSGACSSPGLSLSRSFPSNQPQGDMVAHSGMGTNLAYALVCSGPSQGHAGSHRLAALPFRMSRPALGLEGIHGQQG